MPHVRFPLEPLGSRAKMGSGILEVFIPDPMSVNSILSRKSLRLHLRQLRRAIPPRQQRRAALHLARRLNRWPPFRNARHIAFYMAADGEISPRPLLELACRQGKRCYLPVLRRFPGWQLGFSRVRPSQRLHRHRWGMHENRGSRPLPVAKMDLLFMPLTGFDRQGNRLGMGERSN